jgi:drug/metabolite transporter (DMT)-like permease
MTMTVSKYLVLAGVTVFAAAGDAALSHGMKQTGNMSLSRLPSLILAVLNPWVAIGILLLLGFFAAYTTALSWADLTYVMPATSMGYVLLALVAKFGLHEHVSAARWLGIALITGGVGFVAGGKESTTGTRISQKQQDVSRSSPQTEEHASGERASVSGAGQ